MVVLQKLQLPQNRFISNKAVFKVSHDTHTLIGFQVLHSNGRSKRAYSNALSDFVSYTSATN